MLLKKSHNGSRTMSTIKPDLGPGLGSSNDPNRGKIFPNVKLNKNINLDESYDKKLILFSKKQFNKNTIKNVSGDEFKYLNEILLSFNSDALIVRPDRYILSSYAGDNIADFVDKVLSSVYN